MITWFDRKLCDAGFVINLADRNDRLDLAYGELERANIKGVERQEAVRMTPDHGPDKGIAYHKYGCTQSHIEIAKRQIENNWEYVLYLEDDILFEPFYGLNVENDRINLPKIVPDLITDFETIRPDIMWLGVRLDKGFAEKVTNTLLKPQETVMSHAYVGSLKYAQFLVDNLWWDQPDHYARQWPIDFFMSQINVKNDWTIAAKNYGSNMANNDLKIVVSFPLFFNQRGSYSNLTDKYEDYSIWVKHNYNYYASLRIDTEPCLL